MDRRPTAFLFLFASAVAVASSLPACAEGEPKGATPALPGASPSAAPGSAAWAGENVTCKESKDCASGETCTNGICQMSRCANQTFASEAPLGRVRTFAHKRELVVVNDGADGKRLDAYVGRDRNFVKPAAGAMAIEGTRVLDVAGGNLFGTPEEAVAYVQEDERSLYVRSGTKAPTKIALTFQPDAVAVGDFDGDGIEEAVVTSRFGDVSVCRATEGKCDTSDVGSVVGKDVAAADVDGDGADEAVLLVERSGKSELVVLNLYGLHGGEARNVNLPTQVPFARIASGDLDGDGRSEIVGLEGPGYFSSTIHVLGYVEGELKAFGKLDVGTDVVDLSVGDMNGDDVPEVAALSKSNAVELFTAKERGKLVSTYKAGLSDTRAATRIAMFDVDGDSPSGKLVKSAELVAGNVVPMALLLHPPYSKTRSDGVSSVGLGLGTSTGTSVTDSVTLSASVSIGFSVKIPYVAQVGVSTTIDGSMTKSKSVARTMSVASRFNVDARPELEGPDNGAVVLGCGCFHQYVYQMHDPSGRLGPEGAEVAIYLPVGGQTTLVSVKRYNAMAKALGNLPNITVPYVIGDPGSYPSKPETLAHVPVPQGDLLFKNLSPYRVSDVASTSWWITASNDLTNTEARSVGITGSASIGALGFEVRGSLGKSFGSSYSLTIGESTTFAGSVPPIRNDPRTPEDEFAIYGYSFSPVVYREHWTDKNGADAGFYVLSYTVDR